MGLRMTEDGISIFLEGVKNRNSTMSSYLNRYLYPKYIAAQTERWITENASEGVQWMPITPKYAERKKTKFAAYPGAGQALMVATSKLAYAAQGQKGALKIITDSSMTVGIDTSVVEYAAYPGVERPYMEFSPGTLQDMCDSVAKYWMTGEVT